ncbi:DnaJ domain-containing protein [Synechococcus sp. B60.1]|uniref:DnaJ domain-containing protein n=2 Tax=Synechococcus TaxID=1129 RepID=UPI0039C25261
MDYYAILNLSPQADSEDIKRAFRRLARQFHPDVAGEGSRERFEQIYRAYQVLSNPEERRRYDAQRQSPPSPGKGERRVVVRTTGLDSTSAEPPARDSLEAGIARVKAAWRERKLPTAVALAEALLKRFPNSGEAIHILALAYQRFGNHLIQEGRHRQAEAYLRKALATEPNNRELAFEIRRDLARLGIREGSS